MGLVGLASGAELAWERPRNQSLPPGEQMRKEGIWKRFQAHMNYSAEDLALFKSDPAKAKMVAETRHRTCFSSSRRDPLLAKVPSWKSPPRSVFWRRYASECCSGWPFGRLIDEVETVADIIELMVEQFFRIQDEAVQRSAIRSF